MSPSHRRRVWLCVLIASLLSGCMFRQLGHDLAETRKQAVLRGTVTTDHRTDLPIVVLVYTGEDGSEQLIDDFVLAGPGPYFFVVPAGTYRLSAFEDRNRTFTYESGADASALLRRGEPIEAPAGETLVDLDIEIRAEGRERIPFTFSSADRQGAGDMALRDFRLGEVARIDDPRFSDSNGRRGLWQPMEFVRQVGAGVYFLEPYDPQKIPLLFVHGAGGHPGNWTEIVASLDRDRFQPWLVYYPTAPSLAKTAMSLDRWVQRLYVAHRYDRMAVIAHSMGGLVARAFLNRVLESRDGRLGGLRLFITISTPWDGHNAAQSGVNRAPVVAPSWYDMAPGSPFLRSLLAPELPPSVTQNLLFGYAGRSRLMVRGANDGVVTLESQLDPRAQAQARTMRGFNETHRGILRSPDVAALVNRELALLAAE